MTRETIYVPGSIGPTFQHPIPRSFARCVTQRPLYDPVYPRVWETCPCGRYVVVWDDADIGAPATPLRGKTEEDRQ